MVSTRGHLLVLGVDPFAGDRCSGFVDGDCLWDLSRASTGDGKFDGKVFWVGCGWFFLGRLGEGKRRLKVTFNMVCFFTGRREFPNSLFMLSILY